MSDGGGASIPGAHQVLSWVVTALLAGGLGACVAVGANRPADPHLVAARVPGFGEVAFRIVPGTGAQPTPAQWCALLAATEAQRARGLMGVTDLKGYAGMLFRFTAVTDTTFWMKDTPKPLSIAFFAADGRFVSAADMDPCADDAACQKVATAAAGPYRFAIEVPKGQLGTYGIGPGSTLVVEGACPAA